MKNLRAIAVFVGLFVACISAHGQASRWDWNVQTINQSAPQPGGLYPVLAIPNTGVAVCTAPANAVPCTNYATTYTSATAGTACPISPAPLQFTRPGTNTCVANSDAQGGWGVWMQSGNYQYTVTTPYGSFGPYDFTVGGASSGGLSNQVPGQLPIANTATTANSSVPAYTVVNGVNCPLGSTCALPVTCGGSAFPCYLQQINPTTGATTTTTAAIATGTTSVPVASCAGFTFAPGAIILLQSNNAEWTVGTACTGSTLTLSTRAYYGTSAVAWPSGTKVIQMTAGYSTSASTAPYFYALANGFISYGGTGQNSTANTLSFNGFATFYEGFTASGTSGVNLYGGTNTVYSPQFTAYEPVNPTTNCQTTGGLYRMDASDLWSFLGVANANCTVGSNSIPANSLVWTPATTVGEAPTSGNVPALTVTPAGIVNVPAGGNYEINGVPIGGGITGLTTGYVPVATSSTAIGNSTLDYNVTNAGDFTFGNPIMIPSGSQMNGSALCSLATGCGSSAGVSTLIGPSSTVTGNITITGAAVTQTGNTFSFSTGACSDCLLLSPTGSQTITQPGASTLETYQMNSSTSSVVGTENILWQVGHGYDLGNSGVSTYKLASDQALLTTRGNKQVFQKNVNCYASGDCDLAYEAFMYSGGCLYSSDECTHDRTIQDHQAPVVYGPLVTPSVGALSPAYGANPSGYTYIWVGGDSAPTVFQAPGTIQQFCATFSGTVTAQTGYLGVATPNGSNSFTFSAPATVSVAAATTNQCWTPANFGTINAAAGQTVYFYPGTGNQLAYTSIAGAQVSGVPSAGTYTAGTTYSGVLMSATLSAPTTGAQYVSVSPVSTYGYFDYNLSSGMFSDGLILIDTTQQSSSYGTGTLGTKSTALGLVSYPLTAGTVPTSSAYGILSACSGSGTGHSQTPVSVTCTVTPSVSPASGAFTGPISFTGTTTASSTTISSVSSTTGLVVGQTIIAPGLPYQDTIASIGSGVLTMTLAATANNTAEAMSVNSDISTSLYYSEEAQVTAATALSGGTQSITFLSTYPPTAHDGAAVGQGGMAGAAVANVPNGYQIAWQIVASLPGNIIVIANCRTGSCNSGSGNLPSGSVYFFPMAFINGTNGGQPGSAQLLANTIPFTVADNLVGVLASEVGGGVDWIIYGQNTPADFSIPTSIHQIIHDGPYAPGFDWLISDNGTLSGDTAEMMKNTATYSGSIFDFSHVPGGPFIQIGDGPLGTVNFDLLSVYGYGALNVSSSGWAISNSLAATTLNATTSLSVGSTPPTACTGANNCIAFGQGGTSGTPTASENFIQSLSTGLWQGVGTASLAPLGTSFLYSAAGTPLPTCTTASTGWRLFVTDATSPTYMGAYASGGSVKVPVYCDGSTWRTD